MFLNGLKPVYTMMKLEAKDGSALRVAIVENLENDQSSIVRFGYLSSARVEVVVLHGNFNAKNEESWPPEEFNKHIVWGREKSAKLLNGDLTLKLSGGEAFLESANFTDNSSFTSTKKFRLGLRLVNASGERVLEGITEPFRVKERRVEGMPIWLTVRLCIGFFFRNAPSHVELRLCLLLSLQALKSTTRHCWTTKFGVWKRLVRMGLTTKPYQAVEFILCRSYYNLIRRMNRSYSR
jgi:hypothetical protein